MSLARVRALVVLGMLVLMAAVAAGWAIAKDSETAVRRAAPCIRSTVPFSAGLPARAADVRVNVYNATTRIGLANTVADELKVRGFTVGTVGNDPLQQTVAATVQLRYGPRGAGAAQVLRAWFAGADLTLDTRTDATVDVVLGQRYEGFTTPADHKLEVERLGTPTRPAELCS
jgi:hypothetical protein